MNSTTNKQGIFGLRKNLQRFFVPPPHQMRVLDGIRALSILYVIIFHAFYLVQPEFKELAFFIAFVDKMPTYTNWVWHGDKGVDMFFILSGFLIASILMKEEQAVHARDIRRFYKHRALRILPVYVFALTLAAIAAKGGGNAQYVWANLLFINNLLPLEWIFIPWSWSLSIEVQFYVLFPFILILLYRSQRPITLLVMIFLASTAIRYAVILANPELYEKAIYYHTIKGEAKSLVLFEALYVNLYTRMGPLFLGVILAFIYYRRDAQAKALIARFPKLFLGLGLLAIALIVLVTIVPVFNPNVRYGEEFNLHYLAWYRNLFALGVAILIFLALYEAGIGKIFAWFLSKRFWYPIAQASYSMYLFHIPFLGLAYVSLGERGGKQLIDLPLTTIFAAALLTAVYAFLFSLLVYLLVERPFMNIYKRREKAA